MNTKIVSTETTNPAQLAAQKAFAEKHNLDPYKVYIASTAPALDEKELTKLLRTITLTREVVGRDCVWVSVYTDSVELSAFVSFEAWFKAPTEEQPLALLRNKAAEMKLGRTKIDWFKEKSAVLVSFRRKAQP